VTEPGAPELELTASRYLPFPVARVWSACVTKEGLERWWSPADLRTTVRRLDVRPGGAVSLHVRYVPALLTPESAEAFRAAHIPIAFDLQGRLSEVVEGRVLSFDLALDLGRAESTVTMVTRLELEADGNGTRVRAIGRGPGTPHWVTLGRQNLAAQLERLEQAVRTSQDVGAPSRTTAIRRAPREGRPDPEQTREGRRPA